MASGSVSTPTTQSSFAWTPASGAVMANISTSFLAAFFRIGNSTFLIAALTAWSFLASAARSASPRFYPDDPAWHDDDRAFDASKAVSIEDPNGYDFVVNTFTS